MEAVVRLSRATYTPINSFLELPIDRLEDWAKVVTDVLKSERNSNG